MFNLFRRPGRHNGNGRPQRPLPPIELPPLLESLEDRRLMSVTLVPHAKHATATTQSSHLTSSLKHAAKTIKKSTSSSIKSSSSSATASDSTTGTGTTTGTTTTGTTTTTTTDPTTGCGDHGGGDSNESTTSFSDLQTSDAAAATELTTLATADTLTIASDQTVDVRTINSTTTYYSITLTPSTGTTIKLTVDQAGNPITPPSSGTTTFGAITATAVTSELTTLAGVLNLTAPTSTTAVDVVTDGANTTYTVNLASSSDARRDERISVDENGNPVGNITVPFSALPAGGAVATGLASLASPYGTTLTSSSTNDVSVRTDGDTTTYTIRLASSGQSVSLTVDETGAAATPVTGHGGFNEGGFDFGGFEFGGSGFGGFGFGRRR